jgi:hypothetical protein
MRTRGRHSADWTEDTSGLLVSRPVFKWIELITNRQRKYLSRYCTEAEMYHMTKEEAKDIIDKIRHNNPSSWQYPPTKMEFEVHNENKG